jgi:hypothetical protein
VMAAVAAEVALDQAPGIGAGRQRDRHWGCGLGMHRRCGD